MLGVDPPVYLTHKEANGLGGTTPPPSAEVIQQESRPLQQQLLNKFKSLNEVNVDYQVYLHLNLNRHLVETTFVPAMEATKKYDIPYHIGWTIETESVEPTVSGWCWRTGQVHACSAESLVSM